jgi:voltage-gated potassium channel
MFPVTPLGKFLTSILAIVGVGIFALPTAIITAAILDATNAEKPPSECPHCGERIVH